MRNDFESNYLMHWGIPKMKWGVRRFQNPDGSLTEAGRERYGKGKKREAKEDSKSVDAIASKTKTWVGDADTTFKFLARNSYEQLTNYGHSPLAKNPRYAPKELIKTFHDAFGDDSDAQRKALKLLYSSEVTRFMDEESSDPLSSDVYGRYTESEGRTKSRTSRNADLSSGDSWGHDHTEEWKSYMEENVGHTIASLTNEERASALKESGLSYDDDDYEYIKKIQHSSFVIPMARETNTLIHSALEEYGNILL